MLETITIIAAILELIVILAMRKKMGQVDELMAANEDLHKQIGSLSSLYESQAAYSKKLEKMVVDLRNEKKQMLDKIRNIVGTLKSG